MFSTALQQDEARAQAVRVLRSFYKFVCGSLWTPATATEDAAADTAGGQTADTTASQTDARFCHVITDTYRVTATHKFYALQQGARQIFVVTNTQVPTYALR